jgi:hypothetical protein
VNGSRPFLDRVAERPAALLLGAAGMAFAGLSLWAMVGESSTFDEGVHLAAGYSYVMARDFRMNPEHPPLAKILAALPLLGQTVRWPNDPESWKTANEAIFEYRMLYLSGNDPARMLFWGRVPTVFWALVLIFSIYAVSRELFGPRGALISLGLATFCPNFLAHGHLVTTDIIVSALILLTLTSFWKLLQRATIQRSLSSGILLGGALGAKFSAVMLVPILAWIALAPLLKTRKPKAAAGAQADHPPRGRPALWLRRAVCLGLLLGASYTTLWGLYGFRYWSSNDGSREYSLTSDGPRAGIAGRALTFVSEHRILPAAYLYGLAGVQEHSTQGHPAYALGRHSGTGWWWYFPFALLVKTPVATLLLFGWGLTAAFRRPPAEGTGVDFLLTPLIVYGVLAVASNLNIGLRHLLPVYPLMMVLAGGIERTLADRPGIRWPRRLVTGLLGATLVSALTAAPFFIAYFNLPSRLVFDRHDMLVDSNLDWGQDLARLKDYLDRNGISSLKLAYFGDASPRSLGLRHEFLPGNHSYTFYEAEWKPANGLAPGDYVAVSASNLVGLGLPDQDHYRRALHGLKPVATVGHSILLYRIPEGGR